MSGHLIKCYVAIVVENASFFNLGIISVLQMQPAKISLSNKTAQIHALTGIESAIPEIQVSFAAGIDFLPMLRQRLNLVIKGEPEIRRELC
jgi:hypothetical protein